MRAQVEAQFKEAKVHLAEVEAVYAGNSLPFNNARAKVEAHFNLVKAYAEAEFSQARLAQHGMDALTVGLDDLSLEGRRSLN